MMAKGFFSFVLVAAFVATGFWFGSKLRAIYNRSFPEPAYVIGDYDAPYKKTAKPAVMFSTSPCTYCQSAREILRRENVDYRDFVIDESIEAKRQFDALGGSGVPLLFIGNRRILGFQEVAIRDSIESIQR